MGVAGIHPDTGLVDPRETERGGRKFYEIYGTKTHDLLIVSEIDPRSGNAKSFLVTLDYPTNGSAEEKTRAGYFHSLYTSALIAMLGEDYYGRVEPTYMEILKAADGGDEASKDLKTDLLNLAFSVKIEDGRDYLSTAILPR